MTILQYLFSAYVSALGTILGTPQVEPDPALIAQLEQERPAAVGKNGADALFALPEAPTTGLKLCNMTDQGDCLKVARENLATYHKEATQHQKAWQTQEEAIAALLQYGHFRYRFTPEDPLPPYQRISKQSTLAAYRFVDGEKEAAMTSVCTHAALGLRLINTAQNHVLESLFGVSLITRNVTLLAEMLAESPPGTRLPPACDEVKVQPAEILSLCPQMYGEWRVISADIEKQIAREGLTKTPSASKEQPGQTNINALLHDMTRNLFTQAKAYTLQILMSPCSAESRAAVARSELPDLTPDPSARTQYCSPYNPLCIAAAKGLDYTPYQARLLNVNRYLTALDYLRHPTDTPPAGYHLENNTLTFTRYPAREDEEGMQTVALPLPGSRYNNPKAH